MRRPSSSGGGEAEVVEKVVRFALLVFGEADEEADDDPGLDADDGGSVADGEFGDEVVGGSDVAGFAGGDDGDGLGGGVVGDLAGFVSSVYLLGIPYIQVPTTLFSMIDSSVGGKTGVNMAFGKNMVGSFYAPSLVLADTGTLGTLPSR